MKQTYAILWKSQNSERSGRGKKLMTLQEAEALAAELNLEYPAFHHEPVDTQPEVSVIHETAQSA